MHYLGLAGNVRRYSAFTDDYLIPLIPVHKFITIAALLTGAAQLIFLYNLVHTPLVGPACAGQSLGGDVARVVYHFAAAIRQFRRPPPGRLSRALRVQRGRGSQRTT